MCQQKFAVVLFDLVCGDARKSGDVYIFHGSGSFKVMKKAHRFTDALSEPVRGYATTGGSSTGFNANLEQS